MIIMFAFLSFLSLVTLLSGFIQCCCLCFCKKRIQLKQLKKRPAKKSKRTWLLGLTVGLILSWITFSGIFLASSTYITASINYINSSVSNVFTDTQNLLETLDPSIGKSIDSINVKIQTCSAGFTNLINYTDINSKTKEPMLTLANEVDQTQANVTLIKSKSIAIGALKQNLVTSLSQLNSDGGQIISLINALSSPGYTITNNNGWTWQLSSAFSTAALSSKLSNAVSVTIPNTSNTFASLNTLNLTSYATDIRTTANNITKSINSTVVTKINDVNTDSSRDLKDIKKDVSNLLTNVVDSGVSMLTNASKTFSETFTMVLNYDYYRYIAFACLGSLIILIAVTIFIGFLQRKPKVMKGCNLCSTFLYFFLYIFTILLLLISFIGGIGCTVLFDTTAPSGLLDKIQVTSVRNNFMDIRDECYLHNSSLFTSLSEADIISSNMFNLTHLVENQLDNVDFSGLSSWNSSSSVSLNENPADKVSAITSINLTTLDVTALNTAINTDLPNLVTELQSLKTALQNSKNTVTTSSLNYNPAASNPQMIQAVLDYKSKVDQILSLIDSMTTILIPAVSTQCTTLRNNIVDLKQQASDTIDFANTYTAKYNAIQGNYVTLEAQLKNKFQNHVFVFKNCVIQSTVPIQATLDSDLNCYKFGKSFTQLQVSICSSTLSSLDSSWLALLFLALISTYSIPFVIFSSNALFPPSNRKIYHDESEELFASSSKKWDSKKAELENVPIEDYILKTASFDDDLFID